MKGFIPVGAIGIKSAREKRCQHCTSLMTIIVVVGKNRKSDITIKICEVCDAA